ncbi:EAL domain-containing protein [Aurantimonas sp. MSK8Z-1]|uniref:putative bifunctional diguanylate cyclase/phosphodiesterase n=1 Tax=Mangrovibrevibacter kandeliae TaxID=2968473 RepID=UPI002117F8FE|nr:EAL domain-containing protein [Aurantimonas sp. MSK8Z-1]MCW4114152.1 EAL domain-containing protein [Aurantimonas sp. MSK8Z-1]
MDSMTMTLPSPDLRSLLDGSTKAQFAVGRDGTLLYANRKAAGLLGPDNPDGGTPLAIEPLLKRIAASVFGHRPDRIWADEVRRVASGVAVGSGDFDLRMGRELARIRVFELGSQQRLMEIELLPLIGGTGRDDEGHDLLLETLEHVEEGVVLYDRDANGEDVVRLCNGKAARLLELPDDFLRPGRRRREVIQLCQERGDHPERFDPDDYMERAADGRRVQVLARRPSGRWVMHSSYPRPGSSGSLAFYVDMSETIAFQQSLEDSRAEYEALVETAPTGIAKIDQSGRVVFANAATTILFDRRAQTIDLLAQVVPLDGRPLAFHLESSGRFEAEIRRSHGDRQVIVSVSEPVGRGDSLTRILTFADVTALNEARSRIEHLARHDPLTGLGNRSLFAMTWEEIEKAAEANPSQVHLVALDLDHFKGINDEHGHAVGDALLREVAARLRATAETPDIFRLGGDEFAVILRNGSRRDAIETARRIVARLCDIFEVDEDALSIGCSAGIASMPLDGSTGEQLQRAADIALYQVKRNGRRGVACFDPEQESELVERRRLQTDLAIAVARGDFSLAYQPEIDLNRDSTIGWEALLRWHNKRLGREVPPAVLIPLAEASGLIGLIDLWVIRNAVAQIAAFREAGCEETRISINLSAMTLAGGDVVGWLRDALAEHGVPGNLLQVEISERTTAGQIADIVRALREIHTLGVRIAIDDYGSGQSSLVYIQELPISRLKIDRALTATLGREESAQAIVASIWHLCGRLGLSMTVKGVETAEQWKQLHAIGRIDAQGYYAGAPDTAEIALGRLRSEGRIQAARRLLRARDIA